MNKDTPISITISPKTLFLIVVFAVGAYVLYLLKDLALVVLTSIVIASAIEPAVRWFMRYKFPRFLGVITVYVIIISIFSSLIVFFIPPILDEASGFINTLPEYLDSVAVNNPLTGEAIQNEGSVMFSLNDAIRELRSMFSDTSEGFVRAVSMAFGGLLSFILIMVFSFYFAVQERGIDDFLRLVVPAQYKDEVLSLWERSQRKIGLWMQGQLLLGLIVGVLVYLGLSVLGVKYALLFAIFAGVLEIIPLFGPIIAAIPAVLLAFADGGPSLGFLVIGLYLIIQQFENHLIHPLVVSKVVGVPPILIILALLIGAQLGGFLGIILAVPLSAVLQELVADFSRKKKESLSPSQKSV